MSNISKRVVPKATDLNSPECECHGRPSPGSFELSYPPSVGESQELMLLMMLFPHHQHRARREPHHAIRDAAEKQTVHAAAPVGADDYEVRPLVGSQIHNLLPRHPRAHSVQFSSISVAHLRAES